MRYDNEHYGAAREQDRTTERQLPGTAEQLAPLAKFEAYYKEVGQTRTKRKKRNPALPLAAAFLAGALVIGGMTYAADKNNLFTGGSPGGTAANSAESTSSIYGDAGLSTASLQTNDPIAAIYEQASPAVVKIETYSEPARGNRMDDEWFRQFFGGMPGMGDNNGGRQEEPQGGGREGQSDTGTGALVLSGSGTGFFFDKEGYILTNEHVVSNAKEVKVTVQGYAEPLTAEVLGASYELDLAVLKVTNAEGGDFPALKLGNSDETSIGEWVLAIGNPYGFDQTLTLGVLSAKERPITIQDEKGEHTYEHLLQTDASINPGNSGGPLLNDKGEVIGINTAVNAEAQGIGFAIPTTTIMEVLDGLKNGQI